MIEELQLAGLNEDDSDLDAIEALFTTRPMRPAE
jgi:hypothetical protein